MLRYSLGLVAVMGRTAIDGRQLHRGRLGRLLSKHARAPYPLSTLPKHGRGGSNRE
jgi:hypothetical protein